jgi:putative transcriptional regulator
MAIVVKLDELLHERRMTLTELAERVDITLPNLSILKTGNRKGARDPVLDPRGHLPSPGLPARRHPRVPP